MKKYIITFMCMFLLCGCTTTKNEDTLKSKGNCNAIECMNQIDITNTVDEISEIIGFDGELTDEKYNKYYWELSDDTSLEVSYYSETKANIKIDIPKDSIKSNKVSFDKYDEMKQLLNDGDSFTYDMMVSMIGANGTLVEKGPVTKKYMWVNSEGGYLNASFSQNSGKCTFITWRF